MGFASLSAASSCTKSSFFCGFWLPEFGYQHVPRATIFHRAGFDRNALGEIAAADSRGPSAQRSGMDLLALIEAISLLI